MSERQEGLPVPSIVEYVGPFERHDVVVRGRQVPFLNAIPMQGGMIHLALDHRFGLDLSLQDAERVVPFIADAIAIGLGYSCHPDADQEHIFKRPPFPKMTSVDLPEEGR